MAMCINGMLMTIRSLVLVVHNLKLLETSYVDAVTGKLHPITFPVLIQVMHPSMDASNKVKVTWFKSSDFLIMFLIYHLFFEALTSFGNQSWSADASALDGVLLEKYGLLSSDQGHSETWTFDFKVKLLVV